jgi:enamine deaminase RidA (YjgF/YER057c/UK114 family)
LGGIGNPYVQAIQIIKNIQIALKMAGACLEDVVRTRIYVTNIRNWKKIGQAHSEYFGQIRPAATLIEVRSLINPKLLVEIEADVVLNEKT